MGLTHLLKFLFHAFHLLLLLFYAVKLSSRIFNFCHQAVACFSHRGQLCLPLLQCFQASCAKLLTFLLLLGHCCFSRGRSDSVA